MEEERLFRNLVYNLGWRLEEYELEKWEYSWIGRVDSRVI